MLASGHFLVWGFLKFIITKEPYVTLCNKNLILIRLKSIFLPSIYLRTVCGSENGLSFLDQTSHFRFRILYIQFHEKKLICMSISCSDNHLIIANDEFNVVEPILPTNYHISYNSIEANRQEVCNSFCNFAQKNVCCYLIFI